MGYIATIIVIVILVKFCYCKLISTYFTKNIYDYFITCIHVVDDKNYYMNYGIWKGPSDTLLIANKRMCKYIYKLANLEGEILDVGCGYGFQDFYWKKKIPESSSITAIDISQRQIQFARKKREEMNISNNSLKFIECDAHKLLEHFNKTSFNRIISLESAFHYKERNIFFNNAFSLLKQDGIFIITDIVLSPTYDGSLISKFFLKISCDFLCIPEKNCIHIEEWKTNIRTSGFVIDTFYDISHVTFLPYYKYFFKNFVKNKGYPSFVSDVAYYLAEGNQIFSYVVAVCKKQ